MTTSQHKLADWIICNYRGKDLTPLKLQKLMFYCYGITGAMGYQNEMGLIHFEAWEYGPVVKDVWQKFKNNGKSPITPQNSIEANYSAGAEQVLNAVLAIYGLLPPYALVDQTHREEPWLQVWDNCAGAGEIIPNDVIIPYFENKFRQGHVLPPEVLFDAGSFALDGIPVIEHDNIFDLAETMTRTGRA